MLQYATCQEFIDIDHTEVMSKGNLLPPRMSRRRLLKLKWRRRNKGREPPQSDTIVKSYRLDYCYTFDPAIRHMFATHGLWSRKLKSRRIQHIPSCKVASIGSGLCSCLPARQQLTVQVSQTETSLAQSDLIQRRAQKKLQQQRKFLHLFLSSFCAGGVDESCS